MTFSINTLSVVMGCICGVLGALALRNPMVAIMVAILGGFVTESFLRIQDRE